MQTYQVERRDLVAMSLQADDVWIDPDGMLMFKRLLPDPHTPDAEVLQTVAYFAPGSWVAVYDVSAECHPVP